MSQSIALEERQAQMRERFKPNPANIEVLDGRFGQPLNQREKEVICGMLQGYEDPEIAARLKSTVQCVKNSRKDAYRKLGISTMRGLFPLVIAGNFELRTGQAISKQ